MFTFQKFYLNAWPLLLLLWKKSFFTLSSVFSHQSAQCRSRPSDKGGGGGGVIQILWKGEGPVTQKFFLAPRASFW